MNHDQLQRMIITLLLGMILGVLLGISHTLHEIRDDFRGEVTE